MKTTPIVVLLRILLQSAPVVARLLEEEVEQTALTGGESFGYISAKGLWMQGNGYNCTNIYTQFWVDVKIQVFQECEAKLAAGTYWSVNADDCKNGAEQFTRERIGACFTTTDCSLLGLSASTKVATDFCGGYGLLQDRGFLPARCTGHSEASCKSDAVNKIQEILDDKACVNVTGSALDYVRPIHKMCEVEIEKMEKQAQLPY